MLYPYLENNNKHCKITNFLQYFLQLSQFFPMTPDFFFKDNRHFGVLKQKKTIFHREKNRLQLDTITCNKIQ